ncbi:unnamed protein product [Heterobilharzia americana]|nr:unnamed protein product [Heterobilharzia americana]
MFKCSKGLLYELFIESLFIILLCYTISTHGSVQHPSLSQPLKDDLLAEEIYFKADSAYHKCLAICLYCYENQKSFHHCANIQCPLLQDADFPPNFDKDCVLFASLDMKLKGNMLH